MSARAWCAASARAWCVAGVALAAPAGANAAATDTLVASGQAIALSGDAKHGVAEGLDWVRQDENHQLVGLGVSRQTFSGAQIDIARVTGSLNLTAASSLAGTFEAGPGTQGLTHYTFTRATASTTRVVSARLHITGGGQYVEAAQARTLLLRVETVWLPLAPLSVRAQVAQSVDGNLPTRFAGVRADYAKRVQLYAGLSIGRGAQSVVEVGSVRYERFRGGLIGVAVPVSRCVLGLSWDWLALESQTRRTATLTVALLLPQGA